MRAMILAAGYGKRLRPLTERVPKVLVPVRGKPLIVYHLERLAEAGIDDVVINTAWLGKEIENSLGDGSRFGVNILWSREATPLETGGGIKRALPLLGDTPFVLISGDIWTDFPFEVLAKYKLNEVLAHLILVANPEHHASGDYCLGESGLVRPRPEASQGFTYSGLSVVDPALFSQFPVAAHTFPLREILGPAIESARISGEIYRGSWSDVGTMARLRALNNV